MASAAPKPAPDVIQRTSMAAERTWALRQRRLERAVLTGDRAHLPFATMAFFTGGGVLLALRTVVLVIAQR